MGRKKLLVERYARFQTPSDIENYGSYSDNDKHLFASRRARVF
jgi:hypothetical protein